MKVEVFLFYISIVFKPRISKVIKFFFSKSSEVMYDHLPTLQPALYKVYHQANITKITDPYK